MTKIIHCSGTRKRSVARATLKPGKGKVRVNKVPIDIYNSEILKLKIKEPLILAEDTIKEINIDVNVRGGGVNSQAEAVRLAIARCLAKYDKKLENVFLSYDRHLLIADVRRKEVCKPNDSKARKKRQSSKR